MSKTKILFVDDEKDLILIMGKRIREWGYDLVEASSGKEGIEVIERKAADIVVLDYMMPGMDGLATLEKIRKIDKNIPVIMFTAFPDKRSIDGTEKLGVSAYIPKFSMMSSGEISLRTALSIADNKLKK